VREKRGSGETGEFLGEHSEKRGRNTLAAPAKKPAYREHEWNEDHKIPHSKLFIGRIAKSTIGKAGSIRVYRTMGDHASNGSLGPSRRPFGVWKTPSAKDFLT